jgi:hypothetical protein
VSVDRLAIKVPSEYWLLISEYAYAIQTVNGRDVPGHNFWVMTYSMVDLTPTTAVTLTAIALLYRAPLPAYKRLTDAELKKQDEENSGD